MSYTLLLLAALVACVSARFTVPVPIHYEIETYFQKTTGQAKMRWDPTNYLTYLAAVYCQCSLYTPTTGLARGRILNSTAYSVLQTYFDPSLLQNNLIVYVWDVNSDSAQDSGTVDRDIRRIAGRSTGSGALTQMTGIDRSLGNYDRFGCSVETTCKAQGQPVMTLVCIFGQSVASRFVSGNVNGNNQPPAPTPRPVTSRPIPATTTRPRPRPPQPRQFTGGFYESYADNAYEYYEVVMNEWTSGTLATNYMSPEVVQSEQKLTALNLCKFENNPTSFNSAALAGDFENDVQATMYGYTPSSLPSQSDIATSSETSLNIIRSAVAQQIGNVVNPGSSIACAWAVCTEKVLVGCAVWGYNNNYEDN